jgi:DNA-binding NarL/FixJ family response regulator
VSEQSEETTRVAVASDYFLTREGLACLLSGVDGIDVVARVASHADIVEAVERELPEVVVVGIRAGQVAAEETLAAAGRLRGEHPEVAIVVVALEGDHFAMELLRRGSRGSAFLLDDRITDLDVLVTAIAQAQSGQVTLDSAVVDTLVHRREGSKLDELTLREFDVLAEMAKGHCNRVIAENLSISTKAVERHVTNIFRKLREFDPERFDPRVAAVVAYIDSFGSVRDPDR